MWPLTKFAEKEELMPCQICTLALHMHYVQYMAQHLHNLNSRRREVHKLSIPRTSCSPDPSAPGGQKRNYCGGWFENCSPWNTWPVQSVHPVQSTLKRVNKILCPLRGKALSSSLQFEPISDLFLSLGNAHAHINIRWFNEEGLKYFCIVVVVCFSLQNSRTNLNSIIKNWKMKNHSTFHAEERMVNWVRGSECFVCLS